MGLGASYSCQGENGETRQPDGILPQKSPPALGAAPLQMRAKAGPDVALRGEMLLPRRGGGSRVGGKLPTRMRGLEASAAAGGSSEHPESGWLHIKV